jgi:flagellar biosynthetic protein FlhB
MPSASDRRLPATPRRREAARRQGAMPTAALPAWVASAVVAILLLPWWARSTLAGAAGMMRDAIVAADGRGPAALDVSGMPPLAAWSPTAVVILAAGAAGLAVRFLLDGFVLRPGRIAPDLRRIDPRAGLARIFSRTTLGAVAGNALGLGLLVGAAWLASGPLLSLLAATEPASMEGRSWEAARRAVAAVAAAAAVVAACQWGLSRLRFERSIRMTPEEYAAEARSAQADPKVRLLHQRRMARVSRPPAGDSRSGR